MSERNLDTVLRRIHGKTESMGCCMDYRTFVNTALQGWQAYRNKAFIVVQPPACSKLQHRVEKTYCVATWDTATRLRQLNGRPIGALNALITGPARREHLFLLGSKTYVGYASQGDPLTEEERQDSALLVYERVLAARSLGLAIMDDAQVVVMLNSIEADLDRPHEGDTYRYSEDVVVSDAPSDEHEEEEDDVGALALCAPSSLSTPKPKRKKDDQ